MYTNEQEEIALADFALTGSVYRVIQRLGYHSKSTLYRWLEHKQARLDNWHGTTKGDVSSRTHFGCTEAHLRHPSATSKLEILPPPLVYDSTFPLKVTEALGAKRAVFHPGSASGGDRGAILQRAKAFFKEIIATLDEMNHINVIPLR